MIKKNKRKRKERKKASQSVGTEGCRRSELPASMTERNNNDEIIPIPYIAAGCQLISNATSTGREGTSIISLMNRAIGRQSLKNTIPICNEKHEVARLESSFVVPEK